MDCRSLFKTHPGVSSSRLNSSKAQLKTAWPPSQPLATDQKLPPSFLHGHFLDPNTNLFILECSADGLNTPSIPSCACLHANPREIRNCQKIFYSPLLIKDELEGRPNLELKTLADKIYQRPRWPLADREIVIGLGSRPEIGRGKCDSH